MSGLRSPLALRSDDSPFWGASLCSSAWSDCALCAPRLGCSPLSQHPWRPQTVSLETGHLESLPCPHSPYILCVWTMGHPPFLVPPLSPGSKTPPPLTISPGILEHLQASRPQTRLSILSIPVLSSWPQLGDSPASAWFQESTSVGTPSPDGSLPAAPSVCLWLLLTSGPCLLPGPPHILMAIQASDLCPNTSSSRALKASSRPQL